MEVLQTNLPAPAWAWSVGTVVAYLGLYTAYDKKTKSLGAGGLLDVLAVRQGVDHTLVQMNKVISLAGITTLSLALAPRAELVVSSTTELFDISKYMLLTHAAYSVYKYYGSPNIPSIADFASMPANFTSTSSKDQLAFKRKLSVLLGISGATMLELMWFGVLDVTPVTSVSALTLGVTHFYFMELDFKNQLQVRPFGYLGFVAPVAAIAAAAAVLAKASF